jgi:adenosylcobalamin-dependent ribonucleoside-triphosphate reductase
MDYTKVAEQMAVNGEPGIIWMENVNRYSRMDDMADNADERALGANPCNEQSLEHMELCCLVELFPTKATDLEDFLRTIKFAYLYAKTVTLAKTPWMETNAVIARNRRIGCSMTGITQFLARYNMNDLKKWCEEAYKTIRSWDKVYSEWFAIPRSIKVTSIKPSGTISLLPGVTPGMHWIESRYHIRRVRIGNLDPLLPKLRDAGYHIEPCVGLESTTSVVSFPIDMGPIRAVSEVSMWEQLSMAAFLQRYYSDNQVSVTVTFKKEEGKDIANALNYFQYLLKGVSFLPYYDAGESPYPQMPYEKITESRYREMMVGLRPLNFRNTGNAESEHDGESLSFCDGGVCMRKVDS